MIRVTRFKRKVGGNWYVRYWVDGRLVDESARTKNETEAIRVQARREVELNAGIQPIKHGDIGDLIERYLASLPPKTSKSHHHEAGRILNGFVRICGRKRRDDTFRLSSVRTMSRCGSDR